MDEMRRFIAIIGSVLAALTLTAAPIAAAARPMTGHFTVAVVPVEQRCGPNALTIGFAGAGIATHLGRMTGTGSNCTEFTLTSGAVAIWDGIATYVAADGSSVTVAYEGTQSAPDGGIATTTIVNRVVSGTGRFAGAEGEWEGGGVIDFTTGVFDGVIAGWMDY